MRCRLNDVVMVVRSEMGNEGRFGRIVGRAVVGMKLPGCVIVYDTDDWLVEGSFRTADENIMSIFGAEVARWDSDERNVSLLPFPDASLRPIRPGEGADESLTWAGKPQPVEA